MYTLNMVRIKNAQVYKTYFNEIYTGQNNFLAKKIISFRVEYILFFEYLR